MKLRSAVYAALAICGACSMGAEVAFGRLAAICFGSAQPAWGVLIATVLCAAAGGNWLGGARATSSNPASDLGSLCLLGTCFLSLAAALSLAIRSLTFAAAQSLNPLCYGVAFAGLLGAAALPAGALAAAFPLSVATLESGRARASVGWPLAVSTLGGVVGALITGLWVLPKLSSTGGLILLGGAAFVAGALVIWALDRREAGGRQAYLALMAASLLLGSAVLARGRAAPPGTVYEGESVYNYVRVAQEDNHLYLYLNEALGVHSVDLRDRVLTGSVWDLFLLAPLFNRAPYSTGDVSSVCILGLAGGTVALQYIKVYGQANIVGVELDPQVAAIAEQYFNLSDPRLRVVTSDARAFLQHTPQLFDVILIDAYRPPYVPPHLTTAEFFRLAKARLSSPGVVAINVGRVVGESELVDALARTMASQYPAVYVIDMPREDAGMSNSLVVATTEPTTMWDWAENAAAVSDPALRAVVQRVAGHVRRFSSYGSALTDDRAPVEHIVHRMVWRYLAHGTAWVQGAQQP